MVSGLLTQFQDPISVGQPNQLPVSVGSGNDSGLNGMETEEISECSQDATVADSFMSDLACGTLQMRKEYQLIENSGLGKEQSSSPVSSSAPYYHSVDEITEFAQEMGHSLSPSEQNHLHGCRITSDRDYQCDLNEFPNISSLELGKETSQFEAICTRMGESHGAGDSAQNSSMEKGATACVQAERMFISDDECCRVLFSDAKSDRCDRTTNLRKGSYVSELNDYEVPVESLGTQKADNSHTSTSQIHPSGSDVQEKNLVSQSYVVVPLVTSQQDGLVYNGGPSKPSCFHLTDNSEMQEHPGVSEDPAKLICVNTIATAADSTGTCTHSDERAKQHNEHEDSGALCYEPPRFPSLDVPFFSCDLIQSGSEMQEYSPLGIRQLMMSSLNCVTPFRLWDSPSCDASPDAVLKSAAKTFTSTPSILKKRHRELMSPLSERRIDKKLETAVTSSLSETFSRLDVVFNDGPDKASTLSLSDQKGTTEDFAEDKENIYCTIEKRENKRDDGNESLNVTISENGVPKSHSQDYTKQGNADIEMIWVQSAAEIVSYFSTSLFGRFSCLMNTI